VRVAHAASSLALVGGVSPCCARWFARAAARRRLGREPSLTGGAGAPPYSLTQSPRSGEERRHSWGWSSQKVGLLQVGA
jgi:hypothetical protein